MMERDITRLPGAIVHEIKKAERGLSRNLADVEGPRLVDLRLDGKDYRAYLTPEIQPNGQVQFCFQMLVS